MGTKVTLLQPIKGVTEMRRMTPAAVEEKYGIPPERYPDLAALVGEAADNLPGVRVGQTAAKWIEKYDGLEGVLEHAEEITGRPASPCATTSRTCDATPHERRVHHP